MKIFVLALSSLLMFSCSLTSSRSPDPAAPDPRGFQGHLDMSLDDLALVGFVVPNAYTASLNRCALPPQQLAGMVQMYRGFIDEKYSEIQDDYLKKPLKEKVKFWNTQCADTCSCDIYIGFFEYLEGLNFHISETEQRTIRKLQNVSVDNVAATTCLNRGQWICASRVMRELISRPRR